MKNYSISPREMIAGIWCNRYLIRTLIVRDVIGRYRGSLFGIMWSFFNPVFMLVVYTFVFSVIFKARWLKGGGDESRTEFALILFSGLMIFNFFSECINRAPSLMLENIGYIKRVVFPLEILPWVAVGSSLFHAFVSFLVWLAFYVVLFGVPHITIFLMPLVIYPLLCFTIGISWALASLGTYLPDVRQLMGVLTTAVMFVTPIFYPMSAIPLRYRHYIYANPLAIIIEDVRKILVWGRAPEWTSLVVLSVCGTFVAWLGFALFQNTRKGFADVV